MQSLNGIHNPESEIQVRDALHQPSLDVSPVKTFSAQQ
uniref:Uncharacterized protein n=1 Tax=Candidatus Nitrotoga fabula TaxID=2182327 RepID=A0A2X0R650_9PROT|nr:protein of unknown function [Candidatus Nitrotoga fabula]